MIETGGDKIEDSYKVEKTGKDSDYPWNLENVPVIIKTTAKRIPSRQLYNEMTGQIPYSTTYRLKTAKEAEEIILVPYGSTRLRISQFPVIRR